LTPFQTALQEKLLEMLRALDKKLSEIHGTTGVLDLPIVVQRPLTFISKCRKLQDFFQTNQSFNNDQKSKVQQVMDLVVFIAECVSVNVLLGPQYVSKRMRKRDTRNKNWKMTQDLSSWLKSNCTEKRKLSPRVDDLIAELQASSSPNSSTLIFTQTRCCKELHQILVKNPDINRIFRPEMCVGHNGADGMYWHGVGGQKQVVDRFREKKCRLIVSTSVLEEGLDIPTCDRVFCFEGVSSLRALTQISGRARKSSSKIIIYDSKLNLSNFDQIGNKKRILESVLKRNNFNRTLLPISLLESSLKSEERKKAELRKSYQSHFWVGIKLSQQMGDEELKDHINEQLKQKAIEHLRGQVVDCADSTFLHVDRALRVSMYWDPSYPSCFDHWVTECPPCWLNNRSLWMKRLTSEKKDPQTFCYDIHGLTLGSFISCDKYYVPGEDSNEQLCGKLKFSNTTVTIVWGDETLEFNFPSACRYVLLQTTQDGHDQAKQVVFFLRQPPKIYRCGEDGEVERVVDMWSQYGAHLVYKFILTDGNMEEFESNIEAMNMNAWHGRCSEEVKTPVNKIDLPFELAMSLEHLRTYYGCAVVDFLPSDFYEHLDEGKIQQIELKLLDRRNHDDHEHLFQGSSYERKTTEINIPKQCVRMKRVIITPTRVVVMSPIAILGNRVFREFGADSALQVSIRDEDLKRNLPSRDAIKLIQQLFQCPFVLLGKTYRFPQQQQPI